jgi:glycosyltransferase involved in cell wall biosynthesis
VGGMLDVLTDGENAFLFAPGDGHACRDAIARAAAIDDAGLERMGAAAAMLARHRFDADDETRRYLEVLEMVQEGFDANAGQDHSSDPAARRLSWRARRA